MSDAPLDRLLVLWTSGDRATARHMVLLYTLNAKRRGWWKEVTLLVWGASDRLLAEDAQIQAAVKEIQAAGVEVIACKRCAEDLGLVAPLERLGVDVHYTGELLTEWLAAGRPILTV